MRLRPLGPVLRGSAEEAPKIVPSFATGVASELNRSWVLAPVGFDQRGSSIVLPIQGD